MRARPSGGCLAPMGDVKRFDPFGRWMAGIGSGIAGLTAAYMLSARDRVTLLEADTHIAGHAHAHYLNHSNGNIVGVDAAFLVHNEGTCPTLCPHV